MKKSAPYPEVKLKHLHRLPNPTPESILRLYSSERKNNTIDEWDDCSLIDKHTADSQEFLPTLDKIRLWISPLPHRIRTKLMRDYDNASKKKNEQEAKMLLRVALTQLIEVYKQYPFHNLPYLNSASVDDFGRVNAGAKKQLTISTSAEADGTHFDFILNGETVNDSSESNYTVEQKSPFLGYEFLKERKSKRLKQVAENIASKIMLAVMQMVEIVEDDAHFAAYNIAAQLCKFYGVLPPYWSAVNNDEVAEAAECGVLRMTCPKWWNRQLSKLRDTCCEHMNIAAGLVSESAPYISKEAYQEWVLQQKTAMEWLENTVIENDEGVILPLVEAAMAGVANPSNRLVELIVRARGLEEIANDNNMIGFMVTMTCPSKFHKHSDKWDGTSPKAAQQYLVKQFSKIRSALSYRNIYMTGLRVAEPHKDGTPHWHMLCFVHPENQKTLKDLLKKYAFEIDPKEKGAHKHRLVIEPINKSKGSAVGYVIKYLSKNIAGEFMQGELDLEANSSVAESALWARSWASRHRMRQFQFYGTSSVQIWRELRRIKSGPQSPEIERVKAAACGSDWKSFELAMQQAQLKLSYEVTECGNEYGEATKRVQGIEGISFGKTNLIITRDEKWKIRDANDHEKSAYEALKKKRAQLFSSEMKKPENERLSKKELKIAMPKWNPRFLKDGFSRPWTCRNNCTDSN